MSGSGAGNAAAVTAPAAPTPDPTTSPASAARSTGGGSSAQEAAQAAWRAGFQGRQRRRDRQLRPGRLRHRARELHLEGLLVRRLRLGAQRRRRRRLDSAKERCGGRGPRSRSRPTSARSRSSTTSRRRRRSTSRAETIGADLRRQDHHVERPGDRRRTTTASTCPTRPITPVHRSDDSGTTDELHRLPDQGQPAAPGPTADDTWPIKGGEAAEGTSGVVAAVKGGDGTIGYADDSQAGGLRIVSIKVGERVQRCRPRRARPQVLAELAAAPRPRRTTTLADRHRPHHDRRPAPTRCCSRRT